MSRSVDENLKATLARGDHEKAYDAISGVLSMSHPSCWEIEILGESHSSSQKPFLQDGNSLAFTKVGLLQAFLVARRIFFNCQHDLENVDPDTIRQATAVLLLMDPEHLTAANVRKRVLLVATQKEHHNRAEAELLHFQEKNLTESLLTSRLHRHTKSPNLWSHYRWLLVQFQTWGIPIDVKNELTKVIFVSGDRHSRNYYAWMYGRELVFRHPPSSGEALIQETSKWCFRHHDDISGWMFLLFLTKKWPEKTDSIAGETLKLVAALEWRNESVWYFLRNLAAGLTGEAWRQETVLLARTLLKKTSKTTKEHNVLRKALQMVENVMNDTSALHPKGTVSSSSIE